LDLATVMIASVVLGITVDDTIHLYHGYRRRMLAGVSPLWAIARSYESAGRAVLATSVVLIAQFALLTTSDFIPTANFGLMTAVGLLAGLAFEMLLPALLVLVNYPRPARAGSRRRKSASRSPDTAHHDSRAASTSATTTMPQAAVTRRVLVCHGDDCRQRGAPAVWRRMRAEQRGLAERNRGVRLQLAKTTCLGACDFAPVAQVFPEGTYYGRLDGAAMDRIIDEHLLNGRPVDALALPESAVTPPQD
ncbi:MAG: NAD(P)H-dependent oxidoreductase subunit E, partial [Gammaproteobacteria bacterium]